MAKTRKVRNRKTKCKKLHKHKHNHNHNHKYTHKKIGGVKPKKTISRSRSRSRSRSQSQSRSLAVNEFNLLQNEKNLLINELIEYDIPVDKATKVVNLICNKNTPDDTELDDTGIIRKRADAHKILREYNIDVNKFQNKVITQLCPSFFPPHSAISDATELDDWL